MRMCFELERRPLLLGDTRVWHRIYILASGRTWWRHVVIRKSFFTAIWCGWCFSFHLRLLLVGILGPPSSRVRHNSSAAVVVVGRSVFFFLSSHFLWRIVTHGVVGGSTTVTSICVSNDGTVNLSRSPSLCERSVCGQCPA